MRNDIHTLTEYISEYEQETITLDKNFLKEVFEYNDRKIVMNGTNLLDKYMEELKIGSSLYLLNDSDMKKYKYNPKRLSYDLFDGITEFWFLILQLNEMFSINEFDRNLIRLPSKIVINKIIEIYNLEKSETDLNEEELTKILYVE